MVPSRATAPEQSGALLLWMRVRIVRTVARLPTVSDASAKPPRLNVTTFPYPAPRMLCIALRVNNGSGGISSPCLLCPNEQTSPMVAGMSEKCHEETHAPQQKS